MKQFSSLAVLLFMLVTLIGCGSPESSSVEKPTVKQGAMGAFYIVEQGEQRFLLYDGSYCSSMVELAADNAVELGAVVINKTNSQGTPGNLYLVTAGSQRFLLYDGSYTSSMKELDK